MTKLQVHNEKGFTLIEIAIVMVIIGILAGGGVSLMGMLSERKIRNESAEYLNEAKFALISYAKINGRLPWADNNGDGRKDDGIADCTNCTLPYVDLVLKPKDANSRIIKYALNSSLGDPSTTCSALRVDLTGSPSLVDFDDPTATTLHFAAVLISAGPKDADNDGNVFDDITTGSYQGDNRDGNPRYIRHPQIDNTFDDLVVYISGNSLYKEICDDQVLDVANNTSSVISVFENTRGLVGQVSPSDSRWFRISPGEQFVIKDTAGSIVDSTPDIPVPIAGSSVVITVP